MTIADQEGSWCLINDAKEQRQWLSHELSSLDACSEDYKTNRRAIRGAIGELDKVIRNATRTRGAAARAK